MSSDKEKRKSDGKGMFLSLEESVKRIKKSDSVAQKCTRGGCIEGSQKRNREIVSFKDGKNECDQCRKGRSTSVKKFNDKNNPKVCLHHLQQHSHHN
jgi:Cys-tRNA synthase (O-phospho-L-seryl-tRNA:Cys-tRNA synthase)